MSNLQEQILRLPSGYQEILYKVKALEKHEEYEGAFIFGSTARGEITKDSDIDVKVFVNERYSCKSLIHPFINGIKLDLSFLSLAVAIEDTEQEIKERKRIPMIAESIILFDKTGKLKQLKNKAKKIKPKKPSKKDISTIHFMIYHSDNKAKRNLHEDPTTTMLAMRINLNDVLKYHYEINQKWWVSNKRLLKDLYAWDKKMAELVTEFTSSHEVNETYSIWQKIIDYVREPIGGNIKLEEANCNCRNCRRNLGKLING